MILEKETFEKFGYYPGDLKIKSSKRIIAACDNCGKIREIKKQDYSSLCFLCAMKKQSGENNHNWKGGKIKRICEECGKEFEMDRCALKWRPGIFCNHKCQAQSEEYREKLREAHKSQKFPTHHTKPELIFEQICKKNNLPFKYTGDGTFRIGRLNPDFVEVNHKKVLIEIMGHYWHSPLFNKNVPNYALLKYRKSYYKKHKWIPVFIWDTDLLREDAEQFVLNKLKEFKK